MKYTVFMPFIFLSLFLHAADETSCKGCAAGKLMLQCDYYVAKKGIMEKKHFCEAYAKIVDIDGAYAKAAWYYLLGENPAKALESAKRAISQGQVYANEYAAYALIILSKTDEAVSAMHRFRENIKEHGFVKRDISALQKVYPSVPFEKLMK